MPYSSSPYSCSRCLGWLTICYRRHFHCPRASASGWAASLVSSESLRGSLASNVQPARSRYAPCRRRSSPSRHHGSLRPNAKPDHGCGTPGDLGRGTVRRELGRHRLCHRDQCRGPPVGRSHRGTRTSRAIRRELRRVLPKSPSVASQTSPPAMIPAGRQSLRRNASGGRNLPQPDSTPGQADRSPDRPAGDLDRSPRSRSLFFWGWRSVACRAVAGAVQDLSVEGPKRWR